MRSSSDWAMSSEEDSLKVSSANVAYEEVVRRLRRGEIGANDRLIDKTLAAELNMSRMPAREALVRLVNEGYLVGSTRGFRLPELLRSDILEIFEIRMALEPRAAAAASQVLTPECIEQLQQVIGRSKKATLDNELGKISAANMEFREIWLSVVPNGRLVSVISRYYDHANVVRVKTMHDFETRRIALKLMEALVDGFSRRDSFYVFEQMEQFIAAARDRYVFLNPV